MLRSISAFSASRLATIASQPRQVSPFLATCTATHSLHIGGAVLPKRAKVFAAAISRRFSKSISVCIVFAVLLHMVVSLRILAAVRRTVERPMPGVPVRRELLKFAGTLPGSHAWFTDSHVQRRALRSDRSRSAFTFVNRAILPLSISIPVVEIIVIIHARQRPRSLWHGIRERRFFNIGTSRHFSGLFGYFR